MGGDGVLHHEAIGGEFYPHLLSDMPAGALRSLAGRQLFWQRRRLIAAVSGYFFRPEGTMCGLPHFVAASRKCPIAAVGPGTHIALCHVLSARRVSAERSGAKRMNRMWTLLIAIRSSLWCVPMGMV